VLLHGRVPKLRCEIQPLSRRHRHSLWSSLHDGKDVCRHRDKCYVRQLRGLFHVHGAQQAELRAE
jgi:hypothetical protein